MNDNFEQGFLLRPAALPNLEAVEDAEGAADDEVDGFIVVGVFIVVLVLKSNPVLIFRHENQGSSL